MGSRKDRRQVIRDAGNLRWRRFLAQGVANQPDASVLGPEFRGETELELEIKELEAERNDREAELAQLQVNQDDRSLADQLARDIEELEGVIARERKHKKD